MEKVYLKQNVLTEPLFNNWYAWSYLMSPPTASMYMANSHAKIMQSFVDAPQLHVSALANPAMRGGPFVNYGPDRVGDIKALLEETGARHTHMFDMARAVQELENTLAAEAKGFSLEPLYEKVPPALKGFVELVYDRNNNPSARFIEGLLYRSKYYDSSSQSLMLSTLMQDDRPFAFSTPILEGDDKVHLRVPFNSPALDELFKMKETPREPGQVKEALGLCGQNGALFDSFFTREAPQPGGAYGGDGIRIRYFGHACVLVEARGISILCDPVISYKLDGGVPRYTYADLPNSIDFALITHNHQDHCMFETLLQLRHKIKHLIVPKSDGGLTDPSLKLALQSIGFSNVLAVDEMEAISLGGGEITALPFLGEHADLSIRTKTAYLVNIAGRSILFAADSNNIEPELYRHIHDITGDVDLIFIGMECEGAPLTWLYGPLLTRPIVRKMDQSRRFDGSDHGKALKIVEALNPRQVYVYAMGQEPWLTYLTSIKYTEQSRPIVESNKLVDECKSRGIVSERLFGKKEIFLDAG
jgi:L-ascorbate metabolism protein UlaG (beta-lactamase superfamily)